MKTKHKKLTETAVLSIVLTVLFSSYVYAFAVSSVYYKDNPLTIAPGETTDIQLVLQNMAGSENISVKAVISESSEIIRIIDSSDIYLVPIGQKINTNFRVSIPDSAQIGDNYNATLTFTTITESESGTFAFGSSIEQKIPVFVGNITRPATTETSEQPASLIWLYLIIGIIVLLIIILFAIKRKR